MAANTSGATSSPLSSVSDRLTLDSDSDGTAASSSVVSLLDSLKSPTAADIARKRQTKTNPPLVGKRQCRGNAVFGSQEYLRQVSASRSFAE